jgi:hypothetical protein
MKIVGGSGPDHPLGASAFLCSRPDEESHEIALFADPSFVHIAFKVSSLAELRSFHARVVEKKIPIKFVINHRVSFAFYFDDPDGNIIEVYWPTGDLSCVPLQMEPLDLSQPDEVLLEEIMSAPRPATARDTWAVFDNGNETGVTGKVPRRQSSLARKFPKGPLRHHKHTLRVYYLHAAECEGIRTERGPLCNTTSIRRGRFNVIHHDDGNRPFA